MTIQTKSWQAFLAQVNSTGRFHKAIITSPKHGSAIVTISGEVPSRADHEDIIAIARMHGYHLLAQKLFIPCESKKGKHEDSK